MSPESTIPAQVGNPTLELEALRNELTQLRRELALKDEFISNLNASLDEFEELRPYASKLRKAHRAALRIPLMSRLIRRLVRWLR